MQENLHNFIANILPHALGKVSFQPLRLHVQDICKLQNISIPVFFAP